MASQSGTPQALIISGDERIQGLLQREDSVVVPAFSCRLDGFVNDTFSEYANPSVLRPSSVARARLESTLRNTVYQAGGYYLGFTMYTGAGFEESVEIWIGHRKMALASISEPDNRLHLFVVPERFRFRGGEPIRLVTAETDGPYRIENLVLLPRRPKPSPEALEIYSPHVDTRRGEEGRLRAHVTWTTNRPAKGRLGWGPAEGPKKRTPVKEARVNHEAILDGLELDRDYVYEIAMRDSSGCLECVHEGHFQTDFLPPRSRKKAQRVPLLLRRPASSPVPWPVSVGVPFRQGELGSATDVRLLDEAENEVPIQTRALSDWPDGSVKWLLADFQSDGQQEVALEHGQGIQSSPCDAPLEVKENRKGITVTTGPLRVEFPKRRFVLPGIVSMRGPNGDYDRLSPVTLGPAALVRDGDGEAHFAGEPDAVVLEESGPERACVRIELRHFALQGGAFFRSVFRVHLFRDSRAVRVLHTFENDRTETTFTHVRDLCLRADFEVGGSPTGGVGAKRMEPLTSKPVLLQQTHDNRFRIQRGKKTLARGRRSKGRAELLGQDGTVSLVVRDFWQNYPKGLGVDSDGLLVEICPPLEAGAYPRGGELEDRLYYYLLDGTYKLKPGVARTHELWFHFGPGGSRPPKGLYECVQEPPLYSVSLDTFNRSRAVTRLPAKEGSPYPAYEAWVEAARGAYAEDREESRAYGMLNYGDWFGERTYNWGNQEYDAAWCFLQEYLRDGHPDFYTWAEEAARHLTDVDTCHHSVNPREVGRQFTHCVGHVGGYYPDGYRERAIFTGHSSVSHTWVEGPFLYHLLSGDSRVLESALKTSDRLAGEELNHYDFMNCRTSGWHLIHLSAAYKTTGRRVFLNAARLIVERVLERQRASGGWDRMLVPGHCFCDPPRHTGNAGFMVGILMVGLKRYYEATGEKRVADAIVQAADFCIDSMWDPEKRSFRYTSCPHSAPGGGADMRILKGVASAWHFSGKERFREVLMAGVETAIANQRPRAHRGVGKSICSPMRGAPQVLVDLEGGVGA